MFSGKQKQKFQFLKTAQKVKQQSFLDKEENYSQANAVRETNEDFQEKAN